MSKLSFIGKHVENLHMSEVEVHLMEMEDSAFHNTSVSHCTFDQVEGIGSADWLPAVFVDCEFGTFQGALTVARISELVLSARHKTLLAIIKKLFFQPGRGRQAEALLRGAESYWDQKAADEILRYMLRGELIKKTQGDHGDLYLPQRRHTRRMKNIWEMRSSSRDELWDSMGA